MLRFMKTDPLGPIDMILTALAGLVVGLCLLGAGFAAFGSGSFLGLNDDSPSVTADLSGLTISGGDEEIIHGLQDNAYSFPATMHVGTQDPTTAQRLSVTLPGFSNLLWLIGLLTLGRTAIRRARRDGPFTPTTAARTQLVVWWLLLAAPLVSLGHALGTAVFLDGSVEDVHLGWATFNNFDFPWTLVIAGAAVLTFSRLLRQAGGLQEEVDLTV